MIARTRRDALALAGCAAIASLIPRAAPAASRVYRERVLKKGPVAFWCFAEGSGIVARDASVNGHAGAYRGDVKFGQSRNDGEAAIELNGTNAYVEIPNSAAFSQSTSGRGLTVEAWMRPDALVFAGQTEQRYVHWLGKGQAGEFEWGFRFYSGDSPTRPNRISAYIWNPVSAPGLSNEGAGAYVQDILQAGEWIHIVACYDPGDADDPTAGVSIYKNGELRESPRKSKAARYASYDVRGMPGKAPVRLGTRDRTSFFTGGLADVAIYPRVLRADEIQDNFVS